MHQFQSGKIAEQWVSWKLISRPHGTLLRNILSSVTQDMYVSLLHPSTSHLWELGTFVEANGGYHVRITSCWRISGERNTPEFLRRSRSAERDRVSLDWVPWIYLLSHGQTIRIGTKFEVLRYKTWVFTLTHINSVVFNVKGGCVFTVASQYLSVRRKSKVRDEGTTGECRTHVHREVLNRGSWGQLSIFRSQLTAGRKLSLSKGTCNHMRNSNENVG